MPITKIKNKPVLIVIAGPNGSGKTTITKKVVRHEWSEGVNYINPDDIAEQLFGGWNERDSVLKAAKYSTKLREECLSRKESLMFETVFSTEEKTDFLRRAKDAGYFIRFFFVSTEGPEINALRVAKRVMAGGHDVPIPKIISRYSKSIVNSIMAIRLSDRAYIYDNSIENAEARLLFRTENGKIVKTYTAEIPKWSKQIYDAIEPQNSEKIKSTKKTTK